MPFYFALDKTNYARYGSYYVETLKSIEIIHPGLKEMLKKKKGLTTQAQGKYNLRTALDQRGGCRWYDLLCLISGRNLEIDFIFFWFAF